MKEKNIILISRVVSMMFTPFYLPLVGLAALFFFSYLNTFPLYYILMVMGIVWLFTVLLPTRLIHLRAGIPTKSARKSGEWCPTSSRYSATSSASTS